jgi:hypothetical protein
VDGCLCLYLFAREINVRASTLYLWLCIAGTALSWFFLVGFVTSGGATPLSFLSSMFVNDVAIAVVADLFASAFLFLVFVFVEGRRIGMKGLWVYVPATFLVGLIFGAGLFFYRRAKHMEQHV